jgi:hypothetical protein
VDDDRDRGGERPVLLLCCLMIKTVFFNACYTCASLEVLGTIIELTCCIVHYISLDFLQELTATEDPSANSNTQSTSFSNKGSVGGLSTRDALSPFTKKASSVDESLERSLIKVSAVCVSELL